MHQCHDCMVLNVTAVNIAVIIVLMLFRKRSYRPRIDVEDCKLVTAAHKARLDVTYF